MTDAVLQHGVSLAVRILIDDNYFIMKKVINPWLDLVKDGYNCFGCAPTNRLGLKMEFYEDGDELVSFWNSSDDYQGWLHTLHGGIQATLMDEIAAWIMARKLQCAGMTIRLDMKYRKPVPTGEGITLEVRGSIKEMKRNFAVIEARIIYGGEICSEAEMTYYCFSKEKSASDFYFRGCEVEDVEQQ